MNYKIIDNQGKFTGNVIVNAPTYEKAAELSSFFEENTLTRLEECEINLPEEVSMAMMDTFTLFHMGVNLDGSWSNWKEDDDIRAEGQALIVDMSVF